MNNTAPVVPNRVSIASSCSNVEFTVSRPFSTKKKDKEASAQVCEANATDPEAAGVYKNLISGCPEYDAITKHVGRVRNHIHYRMTMPWSDLGQRLLVTAMLPDYRLLMSEAEVEFWRLVKAFMDVYQWELSQVRAKLGGLKRAEDVYPSEDQVRDKFAFRVTYTPVAENDFRCDIGSEQLQEMQELYDAHYPAMVNAAMRHVHDVTVKTLTKLHDSINWEEGERKRSIFESVFESCLEQIDMLETCNLTGNTQMAAIHAKLKAQFAGAGMQGLSPEALKGDAVLRRQTRDVVAEAIRALPSLEM